MDYCIVNGTFYAVPAQSDELCHYGVKGMRWGKRKDRAEKGSYEAERTAYDQAKREYHQAQRDLKSASRRAVGRKGLKNYRSVEEAALKSELKMIDAKAKYRAAKYKNAEKAQKAADNVYRKEMQKSGLVGSDADVQSGGRSTGIYNHMTITRGKAYADKIEKKVANRAYARIATGVAVTVGAAAVQAMMMKNM